MAAIAFGLPAQDARAQTLLGAQSTGSAMTCGTLIVGAPAAA